MPRIDFHVYLGCSPAEPIARETSDNRYISTSLIALRDICPSSAGASLIPFLPSQPCSKPSSFIVFFHLEALDANIFNTSLITDCTCSLLQPSPGIITTFEACFFISAIALLLSS